MAYIMRLTSIICAIGYLAGSIGTAAAFVPPTTVRQHARVRLRQEAISLPQQSSMRLCSPVMTMAEPGASGVEAASSVRPEKSGRVILKGLQSARFRHPLDQQATEQLAMVPGLELIVRRFMGLIEQAVYLDNIATSVLVGPTQMRPIYESLVEACKVLDLGVVPEIYVKQNPVPNAYTLAVQGKKPFIVIHTSLVDLLTPEELQVVIAHELGHLKCEHGVWVAAANALTLGLYNFGGMLGQFFAERLQGLLLAWQRAAEFSCDRAALLVAQDLEVVLSTFLKLTGGTRSQANELNTGAFLEQARSYETAVSATAIGRLFRAQFEPQLTHPLPILRVKELDRYFKSPAYEGIISRGRQAAEAGAVRRPVQVTGAGTVGVSR